MRKWVIHYGGRNFWKFLLKITPQNVWEAVQWRIQGEGQGIRTPQIRSDACLRLINWLIFFLMKRALHFSTKLNSRDIKKCNGFLVPSYDLFASVFSQSSIFLANGDRRSEIEKHVIVSVRSDLSQKSSTVFSEPKFGLPNQIFLDPPLLCTLDAREQVPSYLHIVLWSYLERSIINCVHNYFISPCQTPFWNMSLAASTKPWTAPDLLKTVYAQGPGAHFCAVVQGLVLVLGHRPATRPNSSLGT